MGYFDHLAIAVDFSEPSKIALEACRTLCALVGTRQVTVLHAVKHVVLPQGDTPKVRARLEVLQARIIRSAQAELDALCAQMRFPEGVELTLKVVEGSPARVIPEAAVALGASVLLVGTHSRKGLKRWLAGSVAEKMVEGARLPVLALPMGDDGVPPEAELSDLEHVLVAVDVHRQADHVVRGALEAAVAFAGKQVEVTLLTVADLPGAPVLPGDDELVVDFMDAMKKDAEALLEELEARHEGDVVRVHHEVRQGDPDEEILNAAEACGARLIVVGSHGQDQAPLLQIGSTTAHVIRYADVSVLVVPSHPDLHQD